MSNLPHPLGDSSAGDLFYPGSPSVVVSDVPGSAGSRAVEFGEDGYSSAVNRGLYALGKNDEYIQERMEEEIARPDFVSFTPAGGNGGNYTFSAKVWCGDSYYTPEDDDVRESLISVLDERYNELIDPTSGDRVVVKEILDAPAGTTQVGSGFVTNPYIVFKRRNPVTGASGADYIIPDGTVVILAFGRASTLDELTTDDNVRDAWFRGFCRSVSEIHASSFLRDGSRAALGDFDLDGNNVENVAELRGESNTALVIRGLGGTSANIDLETTGLVRINDKDLSSQILFNDGETGIQGYHNSVLGSLNSHDQVVAASIEQSVLDIVSFVFTDGTGDVAWASPFRITDHNGVVRTIYANNFTVGTGARWVAIDMTTFTVYDTTTLAANDLPLFYINWSGAAFLLKRDVRRLLNGRLSTQVITVGSKSCDFPADKLQEAVYLAGHLGNSVSSSSPYAGPKIRIIGQVTLSDTLTVVDNVVIEGDESNTSSIVAHTTAASDVVNCAGHPVVFKNLTFHAPSALTDNLVSCFLDPGASSIFENLFFVNDGTYGFKVLFKAGTSLRDNITVRNVIAGSGAAYTFLDSGATTGYWTYTKIENCYMIRASATGTVESFVLRHHGDDLRVSFCNFSGEAAGKFLDVGHRTYIDQSTITNGDDDAVQLYRTLTAITTLRITDCYLVAGGVGGTGNAITLEGVSVASVLDINISGCFIYGCEGGLYTGTQDFNDNSSIRLHGNYFSSVEACVVVACDAYEVTLSENYLNNFNYAVYCDGHLAQFKITHNYFAGWDSGGSDYTCIYYVGASSAHEACLIEGNLFYAGTSATDGRAVDTSCLNCIVRGNIFYDSTEPNTYVRMLRAQGCQIVGNVFGASHEASILVSNTGSEDDEGLLVSGNFFYGAGTTTPSPCVHVIGFENSRILNNFFGNGSTANGSAIEVIGGAAGDYVHGTQVCGNVVNGLKGRGTRYTSDDEVILIYVEAGSSGATPRGCICNENIMRDCAQNDSGKDNYIFKFDAHGQLSHNSVDDPKGPNDAAKKLVIYQLDGIDSSCVGNRLRMNMGLAIEGTGTLYGIVVSASAVVPSYTLIANNMILFNGTPTGIAGLVGITSGLNNLVIGNIVDTSSNSYDALVSTATGQTVVGNYAIAGKITYSSATAASMIIGNNAAGTTAAGSATTSGNI